MRIAWFTPASGESGVVEYSRRVLAALRPFADPVLFSDGPAEEFAEGVATVDFDARPETLAELGRYDAIFYNLGNHVRYHGAIWEVATAHPGIVVLHDRVLQHFFLEYFAVRMRAPERYVARMRALYGPSGEAAAEGILDGRRRGHLDGELSLRHSFIEDAVRGARGVVVHSRWHGEAVRAAWNGPLAELWLPADESPMARRRPVREDDRVTLLTLGHVEFNKHADKVVGIFARDSELAARARYRIVGACDPDSPYVRKLGEQIAGHSQAGSVSLLGYLPPAELDDHAAAADVFVNLRRPNFEGCSSSLMYQLPLGKPVVVYRCGSFAELPDDVVVKVTPGDDAELHQRLRELVDSGRLREQIGTAGRRFAERHSPHSYAQKLTAFAEHVGAWTPRLGIADRVGRELAALGADPRLAGVERVTRETVSLFGSPRM